MLKPHKNKIFEKRLCLSEDELLRYASNKMNEREKHHLEKHITDCELCSDALEGILLMQDSSSMGKYKKEILNSLADKKGIEKRIQIKYYWLAAAAVFAVVLLSGIYFQFIGKSGKPDNDLAVVSEAAKKKSSAEVELYKQEEENTDLTVSDPARESGVSESAAVAEDKKSERQSSKSGEGTITAAAKLENIMMDSSVAIAGNFEADKSIERDAAKEDNGVALSEAANEEELKKAAPEMTTIAPAMEKNKNAGNASVPAERREKMMVDSKDNSGLFNTRNTLNTVKQNIDKKNYRAALDTLNLFQKSNPGDLQAVYYAGVVYYFTNEPAKAVENFNIVMNVHEDSLFEDARWYKALALVKMKDNKNARIVLSKIIGEKSPYRKSAEKMLEQIDGN